MSSRSRDSNGNGSSSILVAETEQLVGEEIVGKPTSSEGISASSRLRLNRIGRDWHEARLACRADQPQTTKRQLGGHEKSLSADSAAAGEKLSAADKMIDDSGHTNQDVKVAKLTDTSLMPLPPPPPPQSRRHNERAKGRNSQVSQQQVTEWIQLRLRRKYPVSAQILLGALSVHQQRRRRQRNGGPNDCQ